MTQQHIGQAYAAVGERAMPAESTERTDYGRPWGRDDSMAIAAVRYCLGRMTYITSDCAEWLVAQWQNITPSARDVIRRDIEEAFLRDDEAREAGDSHKPLGWDCDRSAWEAVRRLWQGLTQS